jgi:prepilin-type N-terminal cleavage/methylation domain-containing protein
MKSKKGFTLIELLAVIVILSVIALIATPVVLSAIGTARTGADKESARGYVKAMEFYCATTLLSSGTAPDWATAKGAVSYKGEVVTVTDGDAAFDSGCNVTSTLDTAEFNGFTLTDLAS